MQSHHTQRIITKFGSPYHRHMSTLTYPPQTTFHNQKQQFVAPVISQSPLASSQPTRTISRNEIYMNDGMTTTAAYRPPSTIMFRANEGTQAAHQSAGYFSQSAPTESQTVTYQSQTPIGTYQSQTPIGTYQGQTPIYQLGQTPVVTPQEPFVEPRKKKFVIKRHTAGCCGGLNSGRCDGGAKCGCLNCRGCCDRGRTTYKRRDTSISVEAPRKVNKKMC